MVNNNLRISGFSSGLDINQIVTDLMKAERMPLNKLSQKQQWMEWQRDEYRSMNLELDNFKKSNEKLRFQSTFNAFSTISPDPASFTAKTTSNAVQGNYNVTVEKVAAVANVTTQSAIKNGGVNAKGDDKILSSGTSEITITTDNGSTTINIDSTMSYKDLGAKIASATDVNGNSLGLRAVFDEATSRFVISSNSTGSSKQISFDDVGTPTNSIAQLITNGGEYSTTDGTTFTAVTKAGSDSEVVVNGATVTSTSNNLSVFGLNITVLKADPGIVKSLVVQSDTEGVVSAIKSFVDSYNGLIDKVNSKLKEPKYRDYAPLTKEERDNLSEDEIKKWEEKAKSGLLKNDSLLSDALGSLRTNMMKPVSSIPSNNINSISEIGISTKYLATDGKLEINEDKLRAAVQNNPDQVMSLFIQVDPLASSTVPSRREYEGIGDRLYNIVNNSISKLNTKAGRPSTSENTDISVLGRNIGEMKSRISRFEDRLTMTEDRYWKQFNAMEKAMEKFNSQSSSLLQSFGGN